MYAKWFMRDFAEDARLSPSTPHDVECVVASSNDFWFAFFRRYQTRDTHKSKDELLWPLAQRNAEHERARCSTEMSQFMVSAIRNINHIRGEGKPSKMWMRMCGIIWLWPPPAAWSPIEERPASK